MKYIVMPVLLGLFILLGSVTARAVPTVSEMNRLQSATALFEQMPSMIPRYVLRHAQGIAVIPGEFKAGFIFGGELGNGVMVARLPDGRWSAPSFITIGGANWGAQIGGEVRNIVLIFNTPAGVAAAESGNLTLGAGASITAGPVGTGVGVNTRIPAVYSYVSSAGAYIGATLNGSVLATDYGANRDVYGMTNPLSLRASAAPEATRGFTCSIARATGAPEQVCG